MADTAKGRTRSTFKEKDPGGPDAASSSGDEPVSAAHFAELFRSAFQSHKAEISMEIQLLRESNDATLQKTLNELKQQAIEVSEKLESTVQRVAETENRISACEDKQGDFDTRLTACESSIKALADQHSAHEKRIIGPEDRQRRCNLRFLGIPESAEGNDCLAFTSTFIPRLVGGKGLTDEVRLDRAHRLPHPSTSQSRRQGVTKANLGHRAIIVAFHYFSERQAVLATAIEKRSFEFQGNTILVFQDFSPETMRKRAAFRDIKQRLYKDNVKFNMVQLTKLSIRWRDARRVFDNAKDAMAFYDKAIAGRASV